MSNSIINQLDFVDYVKDCKVLDIDLFDVNKYGDIKFYENDDYPVIFLKEIESFDFATAKQIAEIHRICWNFQKVLFLYVYTPFESYTTSALNPCTFFYLLKLKIYN